MKVAFICCTSKKLNKKCTAKQMYSPSTLFKSELNYLLQQDFDGIYILSAKYGVLSLHTIIEPYDAFLPNFSKVEYVSWLETVKTQLKTLNISEAHFYTSESYDKDLIIFLTDLGVLCYRHLNGLGIGSKVAWFQKNTKSKGKLF